MSEYKKYYLTSGFSVERWPENKQGLCRLAIFGPFGGLVGVLKYREEDIQKLEEALVVQSPTAIWDQSVE